MTRERITSRKDARLAGAALGLANSFVDARLNAKQPGGLKEQRTAMTENNKDAFEAIADQMDHGGEDVKGLFRIARKIKSLVEHEKW
jgi:hypothetical protein